MLPISGGVVAVGIALTVIYLALYLHLRATQDSREPPALETAIPYLTPAIGLSSNTYFGALRKRYGNLPIFTLRLPGVRIYVINDPRLISAVQRQYKAISFQSVEDRLSQNMFKLTPLCKQIQKSEAEAWRKAPGHVPSPAHLQFKPLAPGRDLDNMNRIMLKSLEESMDDWVPQGSQSRATLLYEWIKEALFVPTTNGVYGPENLFHDAAARKNYWTFFTGIPTMVKGARFLVKDSVTAIDSLASSFAKVLEKGGFKEGSSFIQNLYEYYKVRGYPMEDTTQFISGTSIAVLGNTLPTAFWFITRLFSDPKVLNACREEILAQVVHSQDTAGNQVRTLDVTALKVACPLFHSAFKEVLRVEAVGTGVRGVEEDHMLDGKYLLRKDALVFMPLVSQHFDHELWGADAEEYCYDRFADKTRPRVSNVSFRSFGGGTTLCPGRHFATTELLAFAAMLLLRFEIVPRSGKWVVPTSRNAEMTTNMPAPDFDVDVEIRRRKDDEGLKWVWRLSESENAAMMEDQDEHGNEKA